MTPRVCRAASLCLGLGASIALGASSAPKYGQVPLYFEENRGQTDAQVRYVARGGNVLGFITNEGLTLSLRGESVTMRVAGARVDAPITARAPTEGITNYYLGSRAILGLQHYGSVKVAGVRPGIDMIYHGAGQDLEYDLVIHPGADPAALRLKFSANAAISTSGDIVIPTRSGELRQHKPKVWQEIGGQRRAVDCRYALVRHGEVRLDLAGYERSKELIVDPVFSYSTYLGGTNGDTPTAIAVDAVGGAVITGVTFSTDFPVSSGPAFHLNGGDVFVTSLNATGSNVVFSTFIGGSNTDQANGIALDSSSNIYIAGFTYSLDFPLSQGQTAFPGNQTHGFVVKLNSAGAIVYSSSLVGNGAEICNGLAVDSGGAVYVTGSTSSTNFPVTAGAYSTTQNGGGGSNDAFVAKLSSNGKISYATYLGGASNDVGAAIRIDASGNAFVAGSTNSSNFPTTVGAYKTVYVGSGDAFVAKINPAGTALVYSTFLGGSGSDVGGALFLDGAGNVYVTGNTQSADFPTTVGAFSATKPSPTYATSAFASKLNATGTGLIFSTYIGGNYYDLGTAVAVDANGSAWVAGSAQSSNFPTTPGALRVRQNNQFCCGADQDAFLVKVSPDGTALSYATLLGSASGAEIPAALALDGNGAVYIAGTTTSPSFPTSASAYQKSNPKGSQTFNNTTGFVTKIDLNSQTLCNPSVAPQSASVPGRGGSISFNLTLAPGCPWEAAADSFITLAAPSHGVIASSPVTITGTVAQNDNTGAGRNGFIVFGTTTFAVNQDAGSCIDPVITPSTLSFDVNGGIRNIGMVLPSSCAWAVVSSAPWLSATANAAGNGPSTITIFASQNAFAARSATLTIAGKSIPVTQSGGTCTDTASGTPLTFAAAGGTGVLRISTSANTCAWSAYSAAAWIQFNSSAGSGQGAGSVPFVVASNPGLLPRTSQVVIGDQILTITQAAGPVASTGAAAYSTSLFAGGGNNTNSDGGPATNASFNYYSVTGLAFDPASNSLYVADSYAARIRVVTPDGIINTVAGAGSNTGENVTAFSAQLSSVGYIATDGTSVYLDDNSSRVRRISLGNISTFAGTTTQGFSGDNGPAAAAQFRVPQGIAIDGSTVYVADAGNARVRKISSGNVSTFAGGGSGSLGDSGPPTAATLISPRGLALDPSGNLYISDSGSNRIRKVSQGVITTVAGGGSGGDGVLATAASLFNPNAIALDPSGNLFIAESSRIREVTTDGIITTVIGNATPSALTADASGNIYYADFNVIRKLTVQPAFCTYSVPAPASQPVGGGPLLISVSSAAGCNWTASSDASWITVTSGASGTGNGTLQVSLASNVAGPARSGNIVVAGQIISIAQAGQVLPSMSLSRNTLYFGGGTGFQTVNVNFSCCAGNIHWTAVSTPGFTVLNGSGTGNGAFQVQGVPPGIVTVTAAEVGNSPQQVTIPFVLPQFNPAGPPYGSFDTPANNATGVTGAIAVTGWALDDSQVTKVDIWRERIGTEPVSSNGLVYIGDAVFVNDARPDVIPAHPFAPFNYRAGWGYLLLTNFLPSTSGGGLGNGIYKLHAIAHDAHGFTTDLGTKTITTDNAHAVKPFGTIDTPGQGDTISGAAYINFGWSVTQNPYCIPKDGSTMTVQVDGITIGHPIYDQNRSDIASAFPGLCNSGGAIGIFGLDTTQLTNGPHTISWVVYDSAGHGDGIGSRFFNVQNAGSGSAAPEEPVQLSSAGRRLEALKKDPKHGYVLDAGQLDRIELETGAVSGYLLSNGQRCALPAGSTLRGGIFYWQLAPGFLGDYSLAFVRADGTETRARITVTPTARHLIN